MKYMSECEISQYVHFVLKVLFVNWYEPQPSGPKGNTITLM